MLSLSGHMLMNTDKKELNTDNARAGDSIRPAITVYSTIVSKDTPHTLQVHFCITAA